MDFGTGCISIHGYLLRDGEWAKVASGTRDGRGARRARVPDAGRASMLVDELGRELHAEGRLHNSLAFLINPNLFTINGLTEWTFDGVTAWGEDHDNHSFPDARRLFREARGQKLW